MNSLPASLDERDLVRALAQWSIDVRTVEYARVGFGSYHWLATDPDDVRYFVTVDDLDRKPWLGHDRNSAFEALQSAFDTAVALRDGAGLGFVVAPLTTADGKTVHRITARYSVAVFPSVEGNPGEFSQESTADDRDRLIHVLAELHDATPAVLCIALRRDRELAERAVLDAALRDLNSPWTGGPFAEPARAWLSANAAAVRRMLDGFDQLAARIALSMDQATVTHGEPHQGNLIHSSAGLMLIDWDTVALAPHERDLWMLDRDWADASALYTEATGRPVDRSALEFYRLAWGLADIASFLGLFRSAHEESEDTARAWVSLTEAIDLQDR
jgi:spectinomycin phosphotransferase